MNKFIFSAIISGAIISPVISHAVDKSSWRSAESIINLSTDPATVGREIAIESDKRDTGFGDTETTLTMTLRNASGQESIREMRTRIFEMTDKSVGDKSLTVFDRPRDVEGTAFLTFSKISEPDDQWIYLPDYGRVKRISSKNKSGSFMGSEFSYEDMSSQEVEKYTYKYLGEETCPTDTSLQCLKIERTPAYEYSGYTKQIAWLDASEFRAQKVDYYDRKGSLLKTLVNKEYTLYLGQFWRPHLMQMVNHQTQKSTDLIYASYAFKQGLNEDDFVSSKLKNVR